jgi:protein TonB
MKKLYLVTFLSLSLSLFAQETNQKSEAVKSHNVTNFDSEKNIYIVRTYSPEEKLIRKVGYADQEQTIRQGADELYYQNGQLQIIRNFDNGKLTGELKSFTIDGTVKRIEKYDNGVRIEGKCYDEKGAEVPFVELEVKPQYPGGLEKLYGYISQHFRVGASKETGRIVLSFIVEKDGAMSNITVVESLSPKLDREALRVASHLENWTPGQQDGRLVRVMYSLPINIGAK